MIEQTYVRTRMMMIMAKHGLWLEQCNYAYTSSTNNENEIFVIISNNCSCDTHKYRSKYNLENRLVQVSHKNTQRERKIV